MSLFAALGWSAATAFLLLLMKKPGRQRRRLPTRTVPELQSGITHIAYESVALQRAVEAIHNSRPDQVRRFDLEAALVHARNLVEFFWAPIRHRPIHRDGIYAAHYLRSPDQWRVLRDALPQLPNQRYAAISAQLAHLSVARSSANGARDFEAEIDSIAAALTTVWNRWREELQGSAWAEPLDTQVAHWLATP